jgi:hypothetical protein
MTSQQHTRNKRPTAFAARAAACAFVAALSTTGCGHVKTSVVVQSSTSETNFAGITTTTTSSRAVDLKNQRLGRASSSTTQSLATPRLTPP